MSININTILKKRGQRMRESEERQKSRWFDPAAGGKDF